MVDESEAAELIFYLFYAGCPRHPKQLVIVFSLVPQGTWVVSSFTMLDLFSSFAPDSSRGGDACTGRSEPANEA